MRSARDVTGHRLSLEINLKESSNWGEKKWNLQKPSFLLQHRALIPPSAATLSLASGQQEAKKTSAISPTPTF